MNGLQNGRDLVGRNKEAISQWENFSLDHKKCYLEIRIFNVITIYQRPEIETQGTSVLKMAQVPLFIGRITAAPTTGEPTDEEIKERHLKHIAEITKDLAPPKFADLTEDQQDFLDRKGRYAPYRPRCIESMRKRRT